MTPSPSSPTDHSTPDTWTLVQAVGGDLDRCIGRLADPEAEWSESDAEQIDSLLMVIDDLRSRAQSSSADHADAGGLASLYESPVSADGLTETLDELSRRASIAQEQAWQRAGRPIPMYRSPKPILAKHFVIAPVEVGLVDVPLEGGADASAAEESAAEVIVAEPAGDDEAGPTRPPIDRWAVAVEVLTVVGVLMFVFVIYTVYGTGLSGAQDQRQLDRQFQRQLRASVSLGAGEQEQDSGLLGQPSSEEDDEDAEAAEEVELGPPSPGDPVAILSLPTIGARSIVVEGTRSEELMTGPGHLRSSPMVGRAGNSVVFGRRTTYGASFSELEELRPGDPMDVVTTEGVFRYVVQEVRRVGKGEPDPITSTFSNRLTLVTSDERYATNGRLVAIGLLDGTPVPTPTDADGSIPPAPIVNPDELGTERTGVDWALAILWTQALAIVYFGTRWLYRHWLPWATWLVSAPVFLLVGLVWLDSLARLFPSTL